MEHDLYRAVYDIDIPGNFGNFGVGGSLSQSSQSVAVF